MRGTGVAPHGPPHKHLARGAADGQGLVVGHGLLLAGKEGAPRPQAVVVEKVHSDGCWVKAAAAAAAAGGGAAADGGLFSHRVRLKHSPEGQWGHPADQPPPPGSTIGEVRQRPRQEDLRGGGKGAGGGSNNGRGS